MDIKDIQHLIKFVAKSGAQEVKLEMEDIKITIKTGPDPVQGQTTAFVQQLPQAVIPQASQPVAEATVSAPTTKESTPVENQDHLITIKSPIIGTFYRKASPDKPVFVEVGDTIKKGDVTCVIEAMKLFNEIESEVSGKIVEILVDDASPVEFDQPLFRVDPS